MFSLNIPHKEKLLAAIFCQSTSYVQRFIGFIENLLTDDYLLIELCIAARRQVL